MVSHPVILRGISTRTAEALPTILERTDQDFIAAILEKLQVEGGLDDVMRTRAVRKDSDGILKLLQPVQRTFNIVLLEAICDTYSPFAQVRLDPTRIESAGLVLRRRAIDERGSIVPLKFEGWRQADKTFKGWVTYKNADELEMDPDPERRPKLTAGHPELDRRLARLHPPSEVLTETVSPLFVAPPEVCEATGKTILYGLVPVTSSEISEVPAAFAPFDPEDIANVNHMPPTFREGGPRHMPLPLRGAVVESSQADNPSLADFIAFLRQLAIEFDAFGDGDASRALLAELNSIHLVMGVGVTRPAGEFLQHATRVLLEQPSEEEDPSYDSRHITMPYYWPYISHDQAARILQRVQASIAANLAATVPNEGRFDDADRQYQIQGFIRVIQDRACPPEIVWSKPSQPFTIAPWYESGDTPPVKVQIPDAFDRNLLKSLKPNVAFSMSPKMFNTLQNSKLQGLLEGNAGGGNGTDLGWICSFSIPIITICAFIVLNIFLQLFDIIFRWLLFIKICIPFPRPK